MIGLRELLADPIYKKYFVTVPKLPDCATKCSTPPWRVLFRDQHGWKSTFAETYHEGFKVLKDNSFLDGAIISRRFQFAPPSRIVRVKGKFYIAPDGTKQQVKKSVTWRPKLDPYETRHNWCPYCRRPTIFSYYRKHHALSTLGVEIDPSVLRCGICGASERLVTLT